MLGNYLQEIFTKTIKFSYPDLPLRGEELRQYKPKNSKFADMNDIAEVSKESFKECYFLDVVPSTAKIMNCDVTEGVLKMTVEYSYLTTLVYTISPDLFKKNKIGKNIETISSFLFVVPYSLFQDTIFDRIDIVQDSINYSDNGNGEFYAQMTCKCSVTYCRPFKEQEMFDLRNFIFDLKTKYVKGEYNG